MINDNKCKNHEPQTTGDEFDRQYQLQVKKRKLALGNEVIDGKKPIGYITAGAVQFFQGGGIAYKIDLAVMPVKQGAYTVPIYAGNAPDQASPGPPSVDELADFYRTANEKQDNTWDKPTPKERFYGKD